MPILPARNITNKSKDRQFRTSVSADVYNKLENEASERGITPYKLTQIVMTMYVHGELISSDQQE